LLVVAVAVEAVQVAVLLRNQELTPPEGAVAVVGLETGLVVVAAQQPALLSPVNLTEAPVKVVL
jgi:hypothetical protein